MKRFTLLITACLLATISFAQTGATNTARTSSPNIEIAPIPDQTFTGSAIAPEPIIRFGTLTLKKDTDYTLTYANNINVGTATVTITGKGNFNNTQTVNFKIVPMSLGGRGATPAPKADTRPAN